MEHVHKVVRGVVRELHLEHLADGSGRLVWTVEAGGQRIEQWINCRAPLVTGTMTASYSESEQRIEDWTDVSPLLAGRPVHVAHPPKLLGAEATVTLFLAALPDETGSYWGMRVLPEQTAG